MHDPMVKFTQWLDMAKADAAIKEPTAMTIATATADGAPSARIVLLKGHGADGFLFYTNLSSSKSNQLRENPRAALCFYWMALERQIRIEGSVDPADDDEADDYFASRPRARQIGAWASLQSQNLIRREELDARYRKFEQQFSGGNVPRPPHWSGWRLIPLSIEFWINSDLRLHEREIYRRPSPLAPWNHSLLYP